jgi:uracil-DNA glycosylase
MEELVALPRVGRKTANVVLSVAYKIPAGILIDTHGQRVVTRLGLTKGKTPEKIELELMDRVPRDRWIHFGPALVLQGRYTCTAERPKCPECILNDVCPKIGTAYEGAAATVTKAAVPTKKAAKAEAPVAKAKAKKPVQRDMFAEAADPVAVPDIPADWRAALADEFTKPYWAELQAFVQAERESHQVFPPADEVYTAFRLTPLHEVRVFLLGQDPYHGEGQAHGLCFSVKPGVALPASLRNMYKELQDDLGIPPAKTGYLAKWAEQGMLMLNAVLTVRAGAPNSHKGKGWETFTDAAIRAVNDKPDPVVFVLWGAYAQKKIKLIDADRHIIIESAHPSPLSAASGFFGSKPYSKINAALKKHGYPPIDWKLT